MKVLSSYELRGERIHKYVSMPQPSVTGLAQVVEHLIWVAGQKCPRIEVIES